MNITPQDTTIQPISDDQDLAKALAGVMPDEPAPAETPDALGGLQFEETPGVPVIQLPGAETPAEDASAGEAIQVNVTPTTPAETFAPADNSSLDTIKSQAIDELLPLMERSTQPAEEKFDTYMMLIRSTDDSSLIQPAHEAAKNIVDEARKAEALIEIVREISFLTKKD